MFRFLVGSWLKVLHKRSDLNTRERRTRLRKEENLFDMVTRES
jgi:hypothetical protein